MSYADSEFSYTGPRPHHLVAAAIACVLSLIVHALCLLGITRLDIELPVLFENLRAPAKARAMVLRDVAREAPPRDRSLSEVPPAADLVRAVEALGVPVPQSRLEPPAAESTDLGGPELANLTAPELPAAPATWEPRQEVLAIERQVVSDELPMLERVPIPVVERVISAPDIVVPIDLAQIDVKRRPLGDAARSVITHKPTATPIVLPAPALAPALPGPAVVPTAAVVAGSADLFGETPEAITALKPLERVLRARISTFESRRDRKYGYVKVEIERLGAEILPVIPKDVVLMQDCSASMAEERLRFCRQGLERCLAAIGPDDRFEIVRFRQTAERCFGGWTENVPSNIDQAREFVRAMRPGGNTDILASIRELVAFERQPGRPMVVLLVTDGLATTGRTASSEIIGEFSRLNDGLVSVFAMGTVQTANRYLLDLLSYSNRGEALIVDKGRWNIPEVMGGLMDEVSRPVLADVNFRFPAGARYEMFPVQTSNLYLDRPLVLYGRYPRGQESIAFQAVGRAGERDCDMLFELNLADGAGRGDDTLPTEWARNKIYHLIAQYARQQDPDTLREVQRTARAYRIPIPHSGKF